MANVYDQATVIVDGADPSIAVTVFHRANSNPMAVQAVDSEGNPAGTSTDLDNFVSEDTNFTSGESPRTLDINAALGGNSTRGYLIVRAANLQVELSEDGATWKTAAIIPKGFVFEWTGKLSIDSIRLTHTGSNATYYLQAWR